MSMSLDVLRFITACDQEPSRENAELYFKLIKEEFEEYVVAHRLKDEVEMLDACMDMIWVILDRKSTRLNSSHIPLSRMPSSA